MSHPTMMVRVAISSDDWAVIRILALEAGVTVQQFVGDALRELIRQRTKEE